MAEQRFLLVRLGSLGDVIHALPAAAALRDTFPEARVDWVVARRWSRLLEGNRDLNEAIAMEAGSVAGFAAAARKLRGARYTCAIDFQGLYKSAFLSFASGAARRIGFETTYAREGLAAWFYTDRRNPRGAHKVEHNLTLAEHAGARPSVSAPRFPLAIRADDEEQVDREARAHDFEDFFVLNPGGGWRSKCWPAERYGELHCKLAERYGWRGVVSYGPGEEGLARGVVAAAEEAARRGARRPQIAAPVPLSVGLGPLMALLRRAKFVVSADTGPLHLASALGASVVGLYGPTDPARNGPFRREDVTVRNPRGAGTTYKRGASYAASMLSITVQQVAAAVEKRLGPRE
jgi:heptosyltransferase I